MWAKKGSRTLVEKEGNGTGTGRARRAQGKIHKEKEKKRCNFLILISPWPPGIPRGRAV